MGDGEFTDLNKLMLDCFADLHLTDALMALNHDHFAGVVVQLDHQLPTIVGVDDASAVGQADALVETVTRAGVDLQLEASRYFKLEASTEGNG